MDRTLTASATPSGGSGRPGSPGALIPAPSGGSLVERESQVATWIDEQDSAEEIRKARALLAAWKAQAERGSDEREAAIRLDIRCERRIGMLPETAPRQGHRSDLSQTVRSSHAEEQALSRARALATIPEATFEEVLAEPKPSREKLLKTAVVPEPTVDPSAEESARVHRIVRGPSTEMWPHLFDVDLLNDKAVMTIRESVDSWRRWCERWDEALPDVPRLRRVQ